MLAVLPRASAHRLTKVRVGKEILFTGHASWTFPKHSGLRKQFWPVIRRIVEAGILNHALASVQFEGRLAALMSKENLDWERSKARQRDEPISFRQLQASVVALSIGFLAALTCFGIELALGWKKRLTKVH